MVLEITNNDDLAAYISDDFGLIWDAEKLISIIIGLMFYGNLIRKEKYLQDKYNKWLNLPLKVG